MAGLFQIKSSSLSQVRDTNSVSVVRLHLRKLDVAKRLPLLQKGSNDSSNARACRKSHDADERAILVHVLEDILNRLLKTLDTIFVNITDPHAHMKLLSSWDLSGLAGSFPEG